jgi:hypothetical protein
MLLTLLLTLLLTCADTAAATAADTAADTAALLLGRGADRKTNALAHSHLHTLLCYASVINLGDACAATVGSDGGVVDGLANYYDVMVSGTGCLLTVLVLILWPR